MRRRANQRREQGAYPPLVMACVLLLGAVGMLAGGRMERPMRSPVVPAPKAVGHAARGMITLFDAGAGQLRSMPLEEYLVGVVAAEMPASYHGQALRAQAVAARTRAIFGLRQLGGVGCTLHEGADICSASTHCQAWADDATLHKRWGADYAMYLHRVSEAVQGTSGQIMTYQGKPIQVLYHAVSGGQTEDAEHVFAQALPYLRSVDSPGEEGAKRYESEQRFSASEAASLLNKAFPKARLTAATLAQTLAVLERFDSGRVEWMRIGEVTADGAAFRKVLGLYSANFSLDFEAGELVVRQRGYGHGVGMSQAGADAMARDGSGYTDILLHYYEGVTIAQW